MRKLTLIALTAIASALLPLGAVAAPPGNGGDSAANTKPRTHWLAGSVWAVGTSSLTVNALWTGKHDDQLNGQTVSLAVNSSTEIVSGKDKTPVPLSSIQNGDLVGVLATASDKTLASPTATRIRVYCNCHWIGGTISAIGSSSIGRYDTVLKDTSVIVQVDGSTKYILGKDKKDISFSDLKVGDGAGIVFAASGFFRDPSFDPTKATFMAKQVHLWQKRQVPPPASDSGSSAGTKP